MRRIKLAILKQYYIKKSSINLKQKYKKKPS